MKVRGVTNSNTTEDATASVFLTQLPAAASFPSVCVSICAYGMK